MSSSRVMFLGFPLGYGCRTGHTKMNELPAALPGTLQSKMANLGHTQVLTRLLGDHGLFQATPGIPHRVRCGRVFVRETRVGWRGGGCCTVSSSCTVTTSLPSAGAFFPAALFTLWLHVWATRIYEFTQVKQKAKIFHTKKMTGEGVKWKVKSKAVRS